MKPKGILLVWFALMSLWAVGSLIILAMTIVVEILPDASASPLLLAGALLFAGVTTTTAVAVRRVTGRAARVTRVFGLLSGAAFMLMAVGAAPAENLTASVRAVCGGWLMIGLLSWWIAGRIDAAAQAAS